jgi:CheY-like chemotaxis protein
MPQILLVEDETAVQDIIGRALVGKGYQVLTASDGVTALALLEQTSPDLIILDIYLPTLDGRRVVHEYRQRPGPQAPILVITGGGYAAERAAALGAAGALDKPFRLQELLTTVARLIGPPISRN